MQTVTQLYGISPDELKAVISKELKQQLDGLVNHFQPKQPTEYLTRQQVAEMLDIDISTVQKWSKEGKLNPYSIGARVYFKRSDIENSLQPVYTGR